MAQPDVLVTLRQAISANQTPILSTSADPNTTPDSSITLAQASHLHFTSPHGPKLVFPLSTPTRFFLNEKPVDLRSIFFAWLNKDASVTDYISSIQSLNVQLLSDTKVLNLPFAHRLDLNSWLGGQQDESEYVKPLEGDAAKAAAAATGGDAVTGTKRPRTIDLRLQEIYRGERRISDRNSILHGIKPTDFSHVRRQMAALYNKGRHSSHRGGGPLGDPVSQTALVSNLKRPNQRPSPIILLSPSASSLLRLSNIKKFLEEGTYVPPNSDLATHSGANRLHIMRHMPSIEPNRALQFVLMETTDQFRPDSWSRLVAVLTTGQEWQFKSYKWSTAQELFSRVLGIFVGFNGESVPDNVRKWGRIVKTMGVEKWNPARGEGGRWRDREVVEAIWTAVEESMRVKGWNKENGLK
jgi:parafibromin